MLVFQGLGEFKNFFQKSVRKFGGYFFKWERKIRTNSKLSKKSTQIEGVCLKIVRK
jgi:hypothetical protein